MTTLIAILIWTSIVAIASYTVGQSRGRVEGLDQAARLIFGYPATFISEKNNRTDRRHG
ncbi:hypothetical protein ACRQ5Q_22615 [Bradyrhizobium sp. PMVTL-01]|uniref:hypothetical protein n=1 Tax=Bradyrhizobium sp. PMVTL-01 TaxID=3434999 RepID=UPI003F6F8760